MTRRKIILRRGIILPLLGVALVALFGFVALAIDIGRLSVAKVQCQGAADAAAIAGARTIDGTGPSSLSLATNNAQTAALAHKIFSQPIQASEVTITHGTYHYDDATQKFVPQFTVTAPDCYNLTQVVIRHAVTSSFCGIFARSLATISTTATAAHRPRDVAIVLDYSGSMDNESDLWNNEGVALHGLGRCQEALACYERGLEINSRGSVLWQNKGRALDTLGRTQEAKACFRRARELESG